MKKYEIVATFRASGSHKSAPVYSVRPVTVLRERYTDEGRTLLACVDAEGLEFLGEPADFYATEADAMASIREQAK